MQQVAEKAKVRARQAMEAADAVAEEERVAEQQYEYVFTMSDCVAARSHTLAGVFITCHQALA